MKKRHMSPAFTIADRNETVATGETAETENFYWIGIRRLGAESFSQSFVKGRKSVAFCPTHQKLALVSRVTSPLTNPAPQER